MTILLAFLLKFLLLLHTLPSGCILIWSGSTGSIPSGYVLCDGTNGTPDLRNSFVLGAGNSYTVGQTGGSTDSIVVSHTHTALSVTDPGHTHTLANGCLHWILLTSCQYMIPKEIHCCEATSSSTDYMQ